MVDSKENYKFDLGVEGLSKPHNRTTIKRTGNPQEGTLRANGDRNKCKGL